MVGKLLDSISKLRRSTKFKSAKGGTKIESGLRGSKLNCIGMVGDAYNYTIL